MQDGVDRGMKVTAEKRARGDLLMLHSIIPSFVMWTMRARGTELKKDTHTVTASNPGETPANPEVSENYLDLHRICFHCTSRRIRLSSKV